jgi:hypothetical protein
VGLENDKIYIHEVIEIIGSYRSAWGDQHEKWLTRRSGIEGRMSPFFQFRLLLGRSSAASKESTTVAVRMVVALLALIAVPSNNPETGGADSASAATGTGQAATQGSGTGSTRSAATSVTASNPVSSSPNGAGAAPAAPVYRRRLCRNLGVAGQQAKSLQLRRSGCVRRRNTCPESLIRERRRGVLPVSWIMKCSPTATGAVPRPLVMGVIAGPACLDRRALEQVREPAAPCSRQFQRRGAVGPLPRLKLERHSKKLGTVRDR